MAATYQLASDQTKELLETVLHRYHPRLNLCDVRVGILMAIAAVDDKTGEKKGHAIKGHAGAAAAAQVKAVSLKDRVVKHYDVELLIDGDLWPTLSEPQQIAILDHEMTHIETTDEVDDLQRPKVKMRDEDFIAWGFWEVIQRHGVAAMEHRALKALADQHGQLLLDLPETMKRESAPPAGINTVTISGTGMKPVTLSTEKLSRLGQEIKRHQREKRSAATAPKTPLASGSGKQHKKGPVDVFIPPTNSAA